MRLVLLANPRAGRARNAGAIDDLVARLCDDGHRVRLVGPGFPADELTGCDALVVAGGDGSVHHALRAAIAADVPIYPYPLGTENLLARELGVTRSIDQLLGSIRRGRTRAIDVAACDDRPFVLMCSVGFDAGVVRRVAAGRAGGVRRADYLRHGLSEFINLRVPSLTVRAGGATIADREPGQLIIANSPHYAARLNPCGDARIDDGLLDLLFLPCDSRASLAEWFASIAVGVHTDSPAARRARCASITVATDQDDAAVQLDGESIPIGESAPNALITLRPRGLRILEAV